MKKPFSLFAFFFITLLISCNNITNNKIKISGLAQGTFYNITYIDIKGINYQKQIDSILDSFNKTASLYDSTSIISRINRNEKAVSLNDDFIKIFNKAQEVSIASDGYFDVTIGPIVNVFGFGNKPHHKVSDNELSELLKHVGFNKVSIKNNELIKSDTLIKLDFNAIAQGYSVDLIAVFLESKGISNYLVEIGGEVLARGKKENETLWSVGIEKPSSNKDSEQKLQEILNISNKAIATSGSYRKYYEENGLRYSHTINPKTGEPSRNNLLSVTVMANDCMTADAYATAFMVMGFEKSLYLLENNNNLQAYFISSKPDKSFDIYITEGFKSYLKK